MTSKKWFPWLIVGGVVLVIAMMLGGTYNSLVQERENVNEKFSNVQTQYQRRADLVPNLVNIVKGASNFEQETLNQVVEARSKATGVNINADNATPEDMQRYMEAQNGMTGALSRLLAVVENYPELKAVQGYQDLQVQLEGTENRIQVARTDFNSAARSYNTRVKSFPTNIVASIFGFGEKPYFEAAEGSEQAPTVDFN